MTKIGGELENRDECIGGIQSCAGRYCSYFLNYARLLLTAATRRAGRGDRNDPEVVGVREGNPEIACRYDVVRHYAEQGGEKK